MNRKDRRLAKFGTGGPGLPHPPSPPSPGGPPPRICHPNPNEPSPVRPPVGRGAGMGSQSPMSRGVSLLPHSPRALISPAQVSLLIVRFHHAGLRKDVEMLDWLEYEYGGHLQIDALEDIPQSHVSAIILALDQETTHGTR